MRYRRHLQHGLVIQQDRLGFIQPDLTHLRPVDAQRAGIGRLQLDAIGVLPNHVPGQAVAVVHEHLVGGRRLKTQAGNQQKRQRDDGSTKIVAGGGKPHRGAP